MEPMEFIAVNEEDFSDHSSVHFDELGAENDSLLPINISDERKQELTDALKYCIDMLKEAQVILEFKSNCNNISMRSQLMGKEIQHKIMDMLYSMEFAKDDEVSQYTEKTQCLVEESLHSTNSKEEEEKTNIKLAEKDDEVLQHTEKPTCLLERLLNGTYIREQKETSIKFADKDEVLQYTEKPTCSVEELLHITNSEEGQEKISIKGEKDEVLQYTEKPTCSVEELSHITNSEEEQEKIIIKDEKDVSIVNQSDNCEEKQEDTNLCNYETTLKNINKTISATSHNTSKQPRPKPKQRRLNMDDRIKILERLERGEKPIKLAREYKISKTSILFIRRSKKYLIQRYSIIKGGRKRKRCPNVKHLRVEQALYKWFLQKRSIGDPVTRFRLRQKAIRFYEMLNDRNFKGSSSFIVNFKKRNNIKYLANNEDDISADEEGSHAFYQEFVNYITDNKIPLDKVYSADETELNWKMLPDKTLVINDECKTSEKKLVKDRVTLMVCSNATGSHKLPLFVVGRINPRYLKNIATLPVVYMKKKSAQIDKQLMLMWYQEVFLPEIERIHTSNSEQCLLLLDNAPIHLLEQFNSDKRCRIKYLPPYVNSLVQPMSQGIIYNLKIIYKRNLLRIMLTTNTAENVQKLLKSLGVLQCCHLVNDAWNEVTEIDIRNGWSSIFPFHSDENSEIDSQSLVDIVNQIPGYNNITLNEIDSWLLSDDNGQGWKKLTNRELLFPENYNNRCETEEENNELLNDSDSVSNLTSNIAFDAINKFMSWYRTQNEYSQQDWQYLHKFCEHTLQKVHLTKS